MKPKAQHIIHIALFMAAFQAVWPEPVVSVQSLSDSGSTTIPSRYVKPPPDRPIFEPKPGAEAGAFNIPVVDLGSLLIHGADREPATRAIANACKEWGFFQVVNHGVREDLVRSVRRAWREFFHLPLPDKMAYANSPKTYEGFGSRLGVEKDAALDWGDYYFLNLLPAHIKSPDKFWPAQPSNLRDVTEELGGELVKLCEVLLRPLSMGLGLDEAYLAKAFCGGGKTDHVAGACLRVNQYPRCPQPELTLGLSPHSDPGGLTVLLADDRVEGLQIRKGDVWITVRPIAGAFVVNVGDQIQIMSNGIYKSVEHRVMANSREERLSLALFYNPEGEARIGPAGELLSAQQPALYPSNTFNEYRMHVRKKGPSGKSQVESLRAADFTN